MCTCTVLDEYMYKLHYLRIMCSLCYIVLCFYTCVQVGEFLIKNILTVFCSCDHKDVAIKYIFIIYTRGKYDSFLKCLLIKILKI